MDKFFLKSKTIIGIIVAFLPTLLPQFGWSHLAPSKGNSSQQTLTYVIQGAVSGIVCRLRSIRCWRH